MKELIKEAFQGVDRKEIVGSAIAVFVGVPIMFAALIFFAVVMQS